MHSPVLLIIDDDVADRFLIKRRLKPALLGLEFVECVDGVDGLEFFTSLAQEGSGNPIPDLVLLDINMPRLNGYEFLDAYASLIQANPRVRTDVLVMLTSVSREDERRCRAHDFVRGQVSKDPLRAAETLQMIVATLEEKRRG